jgi:hypothetical protein
MKLCLKDYRDRINRSFADKESPPAQAELDRTHNTHVTKLSSSAKN